MLKAAGFFMRILFVILRITNNDNKNLVRCELFTIQYFETMEIKVLGTGCASCKALYTAVIQAVSETGIEAKVVKVEELTEIMKYNVMSMPALVIDGKVVSSGRKPTVSEVKKLLVK